MIKPLRSQAGFTLLEMMIVVAVIAIMAGIAVPNMQSGVKSALARSHAKSMMKTIGANRATDQGFVPLPEALGTDLCSFCTAGIGAGADLKTWAPTAGYLEAWRRIGFDKIPLDPWGRPYILDENDEEFGRDCRHDAIWSAGADGIWEGPGDGDDVAGDDLIARLKPARQDGCRENPVTGGF